MKKRTGELKRRNYKRKKAGDCMNPTFVRNYETQQEVVEQMSRYLTKLKKLQKEAKDESYLDAREALMRTGVINKSGKTKKKIVTWE